jgi:hypothetical protein
MGSDNIIPFPGAIQAEIDAEMRRAIAKFGDDHIEIIAIANSRGDTMDDRQVLEALRKLNRVGSMSDRAD